MSTFWPIAAFLSLVPILWYQKRRWRQLGSPPLAQVGFPDLIHYLWVIALWPWPIGVLTGIVYFERQGNADRVDKLNRHFDSLSLLSRRASAAQLASVFDPAALQGISVPPAPGWWLASDQNWYPPEQHPN